MLTPNQIWQDALNELEKEVQTISFDVWIKNLIPYAFVDSTLILHAPSSMSIDVVKGSYLEVIKRIVLGLNTFVTDVDILSSSDDSSERVKSSSSLILEPQLEEVGEKVFKFDPRYTFSSFVVGDSNRFTHAVAQVVAQNPGKQHNPLFIYGGVGLGKTHVMHAIGNYIQTKNPELKLVYTTSERFTNELIAAIRNTKNADHNQKFREKYRNVDVLMIDDIQFIENKPSTQQELFHTFNELYNDHKQIILTSDRVPRDIPNLEERLRTRFEWGMIADIQPPSLETKVAILQMKAEQEHRSVPVDVLYSIASMVESNIREMESLLSRVVFFAELTGRLPSMEVAEDAFKGYLVPTVEKLNQDSILSAVSSYFGVAKEAIVGKKKTKDIVEPRQIAVYLMNEMLSLPLVAIGQTLGGRDHTTIMYARDKITAKLKEDTKLQVQIRDLKNIIERK